MIHRQAQIDCRHANRRQLIGRNTEGRDSKIACFHKRPHVIYMGEKLPLVYAGAYRRLKLAMDPS